MFLSRYLRTWFCRLLFSASIGLTSSFAQSDFENDPIRYSKTDATDKITQLSRNLESGKVQLSWDEKHGWLPSILKSLQVPESSQTLVFSKTSMQFRHISPSRPRAIYFNDDIYVGWVQNGEVVELGAADKKLGAVFYTVEQTKLRPVVKRDRQGECLACHANGRTQRVPGFLVRSVYPRSSGQPEFRFGSLTTDHKTPFGKRFGGWYVTGKHGTMRHRGNVFVSAKSPEDESKLLDVEAGANRLSLPKSIANSYLKPTSDLVALMLLEHQTQMHNWITKASYTYQQAIHQQLTMNRLLDRDEQYRSESTLRRLDKAANDLVTYLLFSGEPKWSSAVQGDSEFARDFAATAIRDRQGRSLRDLDLKTRLLRYPCSYLIYSESFTSLPEAILKRVKQRMLEVLEGEIRDEEFSNLSSSDRKCILEILQETHSLFDGN